MTVTATGCGTAEKKLQIECTKCKRVVSSCSATHNYQGRTYSVSDIRQVYFSLVSGIGYAGLKLNQALVTGGEMSKGKFVRHCSYLYKVMDTFYNEKMEECRTAVFRLYREKLNRKPDKNSILDVAVSFDCSSWMKRGHKSHIGIGFAVEMNLGMVVDLDVLCNNCRQCGPKKQHKCHKNFNGKSGTMKAEIAVRIWSRTTNYNMRFTIYISNGDSSAYSAVCRLNDGRGPYEVPIIKEECENHVNKRMGARLRKLKKERPARKGKEVFWEE